MGGPAINVELPLVGEPGPDVHVRCSWRHFHGTGEPKTGPFWEAHPKLLAWAGSTLGRREGMGVSYDVRGAAIGELPEPAVYYRGKEVRSFFEALGTLEAARIHREAVRRLVPSRFGGTRGLMACEMSLVYLKLRFSGSMPLDVKAHYQTDWRPV